MLFLGWAYSWAYSWTYIYVVFCMFTCMVNALFWAKTRLFCVFVGGLLLFLICFSLFFWGHLFSCLSFVVRRKLCVSHSFGHASAKKCRGYFV